MHNTFLLKIRFKLKFEIDFSADSNIIFHLYIQYLFNEYDDE